MVDQKIIDIHIQKELPEKGKSESTGSLLRQIILGGQDGLVNVLGIILGVAAATRDPKIAIIAGLTATFAESISMGAVAYTSQKAEKDHYFAELGREKWEIKHLPEIEREEIKVIYMRKGFRGRQLDELVDKVCSDEKEWLDVMMDDELGLKGLDTLNPGREAIVVGGSALVGSFLPLLPFFLLPISAAVPVSIILAALVLFSVGYIKGKLTTGNPIKSGLELAVIGMLAAFIGYAIGFVLGVYFLGNGAAAVVVS